MLKQWFKPSCQTNWFKTLQIAVFSTHVEAILQAFLPNNLLQNIVDYPVFYTCWSNGSSLVAKQLAPKHCKLQCFRAMHHQWPKPFFQTTCPKTLWITVFSTHIGPMAQAFLPNNLPQNTAKYNAFLLMLKQWFKPSCQTTCPKTLQITVFSSHAPSMAQAFLPNNLSQPILDQWPKLLQNTFMPKASKHCISQCFQNTVFHSVFKTLYFTVFSTYVEAMVQAFLPNKLVQNTANYSVLYTCWSNTSSLLAKQLASKHCRLPLFSSHVEAMVQALLPNNLPQNTANYSVFEPCTINGPSPSSKQLAPKHCELHCFPPILDQWPKLSCQTTCPKTLQSTMLFYSCWSNGSSLLAKQLAPKHCKLQCFRAMHHQWPKPFFQTTCPNPYWTNGPSFCKIRSCPKLQNTVFHSVFKTLYFTVFSTYVEAMVQAFLPNKLVQNTANYSVLYTCWSNTSSLLAKQLASKHCRLPCFLHMLKQWFKPCCQTTCPKTLQITVFSSHAPSMAQALLADNLPQNTVNYSVFHPYWTNGPSFLAKQLAPKHCKVQCFFTHVEAMVPAFLPNKSLQNTVNYTCWSNFSILLAKQVTMFSTSWKQRSTHPC